MASSPACKAPSAGPEVAGYTACVTGGGGFVASHIIKQLLERGWTVRATIRKGSKVGALLKLASTLPGYLSLHEADLLRPGAFDEVVSGCDFVFHAASPFVFGVPHDDVLLPALEGTRNVLSAVAAAPSPLRPRRVVLTSSCAAVKGKTSPSPPSNGISYTEADWNTTSSVDANGEAYWVSKTTAERLAWDMAKQHGLDVVTICPEFVIGPPVSATNCASTSVGFMKGWLEGTPSEGRLTFAADVRDVARAHFLAAITPAAHGRYIVADTRSVDPAFVSAVLSARFPGLAIPVGESVPEDAGAFLVDGSRARNELGLRPRPLDETLVDMAVVLIALGVAKPKAKDRAKKAA